MKLTKILQEVIAEIGDASAGIYPIKEKSAKGRFGTVYTFKTEYKDPKTNKIDGTPYEVEVTPWGGLDSINVQFGVASTKNSLDTQVETNRGELYKVMATVVECVKRALAKNPKIKEIYFEPSKKDPNDKRRFNLYMAYFEKQLKPKKVTFDGDSAVIKIK